MPLEHETKFPLTDCLAVARRLAEQARPVLPWHFESNVVHDRGGELARAGRLLRLRQALHATLTLKEPASSIAPGVKSRLEHESRVDNPAAVDAMLRALGLIPVARYEKFRSVWDAGRGLLCLDILPFGHFLEIEADPGAIPGLLRGLGLDPAEASGHSYHELHRQWRDRMGLPPDPDFVFDPAQRHRLATLLGCAARTPGECTC